MKIQEKTREVICPVSEMVGDVHHFQSGTGQVIEWHVMGDSRTEVEVCSCCAEPLDLVNN